MRVVIIRDGSFTLNQGRPASNLLHYEMFSKRYLSVFDQVSIVGRLFEEEDATSLPIEGDGVEFIALPGRRGVKGLILSFCEVAKLANKLTKESDAFLLRVPGTIPSIFYFFLKLRRVPFGVEVAADPYDSYSKASLNNHILSGLVQKLFVGLVKKQCQEAATTIYVTKNALQTAYPPAKNSNSFGCTSIDLPKKCFVKSPRLDSDFDVLRPRMILVGNMQGAMKGHDVLLHALKLIKDAGVDASLDVIGYGSNQPAFEALARKLGVYESVNFMGKVRAGEAIYKALRGADLFVLPSRQEGLPRALIEAMSQALPAIATRVGGTPELLDDIALVPPDDPAALAEKIVSFLSNPTLLGQQSLRNLTVAHEYSAEAVGLVRRSFMSELKRVSITK